MRGFGCNGLVLRPCISMRVEGDASGGSAGLSRQERRKRTKKGANNGKPAKVLRLPDFVRRITSGVAVWRPSDVSAQFGQDAAKSASDEATIWSVTDMLTQTPPNVRAPANAAPTDETLWRAEGALTGDDNQGASGSDGGANGTGANGAPANGGGGSNNSNDDGDSARARLAELQRRLGEIVGLMAHSAGHEHLFLSDLRWAVLPPLGLGQCRLVRDKSGRLVAYVSWAWVSEEVENRLAAGNAKLRPAEWKSGEQAVIMDLLLAGGGEAAQKRILDGLKEKVFPGKTLKTLRWNAAQGQTTLQEV